MLCFVCVFSPLCDITFTLTFVVPFFMHSSFTMLPSLYFNSQIPTVQPGWHVQSFWLKNKPSQQAKRMLRVSNRLTSNSFYSHWDKTIAKELYKTQNKRDFNNSAEDYFTPIQCSYTYNQQTCGAQYYLMLLVGWIQIQKCIRNNNNKSTGSFYCYGNITIHL